MYINTYVYNISVLSLVPAGKIIRSKGGMVSFVSYAC